jgi:hypothetical protein
MTEFEACMRRSSDQELRDVKKSKFVNEKHVLVRNREDIP